jgi:hypothetical protein
LDSVNRVALDVEIREIWPLSVKMPFDGIDLRSVSADAEHVDLSVGSIERELEIAEYVEDALYFAWIHEASAGALLGSILELMC